MFNKMGWDTGWGTKIMGMEKILKRLDDGDNDSQQTAK